jgi:SNF2 family DNA or RNA helicase
MTATPFGKELVDMFYMFNLLVPDFMSWPRFDNRHRNTFTINKQIRTKYGKTFTKKIDIVKNYKNFKEFHNAISPHMVRRKKNIADKALGPKHTHPIFLPVSDKFLELYNRFSNDIVNAVKKQYNKKEQGLATLLGVSLLRQFCNYVGLFEESSAKLLSHIPYREYMIETPTPKLDWTVNTVKKIDDKVIIFTEFAKMANVLNNHLTNLGYKTKIITGSTERDDREELRKSFQKDRFQILVGTNAIAYGGNFQFVDHLINYDMAYNPEVNWQREGRIHRLGNTNEKHIYNLTLQSGIPDSPLIEELIYQKVTRRMQEAEKAVDGRELEIDHNDDSVIKEISKKLFK